MSVVSRITRAPILTSMKLNSTELHFFFERRVEKKGREQKQNSVALLEDYYIARSCEKMPPPLCYHTDLCSYLCH